MCILLLLVCLKSLTNLTKNGKDALRYVLELAPLATKDQATKVSYIMAKGLS